MRLLITGGSGFIGTNLVDGFSDQEVEIINVDIQEPKKSSHRRYWKRCDILDFGLLKDVFREFNPTHVVHLAARTDTFGKSLSDYRVNTEGTKHVLAAVNSCSSVERLVVTSTQFVCKPGKVPNSDEDYEPHTVYGHSKVIAEKYTRLANLDCIWTIIRPTNIWGPWHPRYPYEFWKILSKGLYLHPGGKSPVRCYGYVKNVVDQIQKILVLPREDVHGTVIYLGDPPIQLIEWVNGFSKALTGKDVRVVPRTFIRMLAYIGDVLSLLGIRFAITSSRFSSMVEDYIVPMEPTFKRLGYPAISLEDGIKETAIWLREQGFVQKIYV